MVAQSLARTKAEDPHARVEWLLMYVRLERVLKLVTLLEKVYPPHLASIDAFSYIRPARFQLGLHYYPMRFEHTLQCLRVNFGAKTYLKYLHCIASKIYPSRLSNSESCGDRSMNASAIMDNVFLSQEVHEKEHPIYSADLEIEHVGSSIHSSASAQIEPVEPTKTHVYIHWRTNTVQQSQQSSDSVNIYNLSQEHISSIVSRKNSLHTSSHENNRCIESEIEVVSMLHEPYDYSESHTLKKIDGFLVTDGKTRPRMTLKDSLSYGEKQRGRAALSQYVATNTKPGVYLWRTTDS